jgi:hypothetical protein
MEKRSAQFRTKESVTCLGCGYRVDIKTAHAELNGRLVHLACASSPQVVRSRVPIPELDNWLLEHGVKK